VWRGAGRQQPVAALLAHRQVRVVSLDEAQAKAIGELCGRSAISDIVDASVVLCARLTESTVISSDPDDLRRLDPRLMVVPL
jgi:PIN domain-containing protein